MKAPRPAITSARPDCGHDRRRRRDRDVQAVVLADAEHIKTGLVGELCGGENLGVTLSNADRAAGVRIGGNVAEGVDA